MHTVPQKTYRYSPQRERLYQVLSGTDTHPTANWLYDQLKKEFPSLSLGTVYRNLGILIEQGKAKKIDAGSTFDRYEAKTTPHYHLICRTCGKIIDIEENVFPELVDTMRHKTCFDIDGYRIDFFGTCRTCAKKT
ncbi:transcriptional repressor [Prosthecochloris sp. N3]|uniref:Transcriptional repressor n=1 Tax=Prosthecochloris ethylica TaxID=2743976 RepID=A0ABR9XRA3_9CHLB|nr:MULTISPECIES: transcriptional repressor [Prosthecochloris]MEC9486954.1 transcriptional repressor [Prosthecochloris sp.]MBF0586304.1 transcriptional repressor [Prosthecochloris ethylica]MBF0636478.1 transcriptional repressor [Prosthecochloris ethylica]NUK47652.1 transcriptional repressor [Prosthecochloris ethylica]RNA64117.1 transcriptional repressor [Prosthecochloris sp. ZM_2]